MTTTKSRCAQDAIRIALGGIASGMGDSLLCSALHRIKPARCYQHVASGLLGEAALSGGAATAIIGGLLHFFIATTAAAVYVGASRRLPVLVHRPVLCGLAFGFAVYFFMKSLVLPLSAVPRLGPFEPLAMLGHAVLVGLPISLLASVAVAPSAAPKA